MRTFTLLSGVTLILTLLLMSLGAYVKATGAGLACPDWPTCYGRLFPPFPSHGPFTSEQILSEYLHRLLASVVGALVLVQAGLAFRLRDLPQPVRIASVLALPILLVQIGLGAWTVVGLLEPWIVTAHLANATLLLVLLSLSWGWSWFHDRESPHGRASAFR